MALLIRNQAAFVEQVARNDQERLALREWQHKTERWQHQTEERLGKIEAALAEMPNTILQSVLQELPKIIIKDILDKLPKALKKEIGFKPQPAR
jgi:Mg/Co/Ni transporter MgtE